MTYDQGDNLLNNLPPNAAGEPPVPEGQAGRPIPKTLWSPLRGDLSMLTVFSRELQRARMRNGAIDLSQSEGGQLKFRLDENGLPVEVGDTPHKEIHDTIAELMILANGAAARLIHSEYPSATLLRSHTSPSLDRLREVQEITQGFGLSDVFLGQSDEALMSQVESFKKSLGKNRKSNPAVVHLVTSMVIRAMSEALYLCSENEGGNSSSSGGSSKMVGRNGQPIRHYGLGVEYYTHFTSPIRRYADVIVHRQLLQTLEVQQRRRSQPTGALLTFAPSRDRPSPTDLLLPQSKAISIVSESQWQNTSVPEDGGHQVRMTLAADGRKMFDKIGTSEVEAGHELLPAQAPPPALPPAQAAEPEDDDLDLLDSLLDGIGGDLLDSVQHSRSQPNAPAPLPPLAPVTEPSPLHMDRKGKEEEKKEEYEAEDLDDELDALLGGIDENALSVAASSSRAALPQSHHPVAAEKPPLVPSTEEGREKSTEKSAGDVPPPYPSQQLASIADHINKMNRRAKIIQFECQVLFLRHYFMTREEKHVAVVYALKENGFLAYVPALDFKGSVFLMTDDNSTVCLNPQLLSLPRAAGEAVTTPQHAGKMESLKSFPTHSCHLLEAQPPGGGEGETELVICPKSQDPKDGKGKGGSLRLRAMQRVVVSVYSSLNQTDGIPELCLQLWSTDVSSLKAKRGDAASHASVMETKEAEATPLSPPKETSRSLYELLSELLTKSSETSLLGGGAQSKRNKKAQTKRAQKASGARRIAFQGTGRVAYGEPEERELFAPLFHERTPASSSSAQEPSHEGNLLRGKALAMQQMKLWGEEWAEEEDLPSSASLSSSGDDPAGRSSSDLPEGFNVRKEVGIANQRIQKLKVAKRNSKY
jgi:hypothetical protein